jgi:putative transposase
MSYRTIKIAWLPRSSSQWAIFTASRLEAGKLWSDLVERHHAARSASTVWPSKGVLQKEAKGKYPSINSQSAQQIIGEFVEAVNSTRQLRRKGHIEARFPWRKPKYHNVTYTNQGARIRDGVLILPHGSAGSLRIRIPITVTLPGRIMEVCLHYGEVSIVCEVADTVQKVTKTIGVDLGVNSLIAATDGKKAVVISGRRMKSIVRLRNKRLGSICSAQAAKTKGSRRYKRLQRRKYQVLEKSRRQTTDVCHKATRKIADAFPKAKAYVGKPFNDAAQKVGRKQAQQVSQACNGKIIQLLDYKLSGGAIQINEAYSSQTDPVCGKRNKCGRIYKCQCGTRAPRDVIGCVNIRSIGMVGLMVPGRRLPKTIHFVHPDTYPVATRVVARTPRKLLVAAKQREAVKR